MLLNNHCIHLCVDMQRMFAEETPWHTPWMSRVLPAIAEITARHAAQTVFTRFIPPPRADKAPGMWRAYYERWPEMTQEKIDPALLQIVPELARFCPPAEIVDKHVYGPWMETDLHARLQARGVHTLVVTGGETDMCVLTTVMGAVDLGYRILLVTDALCSSSDKTHDAIMDVYARRYSVQVELVKTDDVLA